MSRYQDHKAWERVKQKKSFYKHFSAFLGVNLGLLMMNVIVSPGHWWFQYTTIGWGMGLAVHYFTAFGVPRIGPLDDEWEQREYEKEIERRDSHMYNEELDLNELPSLRPKWKDSDLV